MSIAITLILKLKITKNAIKYGIGTAISAGIVSYVYVTSYSEAVRIII